MSLLDRLRIEGTKDYRPDRSLNTTFATIPTGETQLNGFATQEKFVMRLEVVSYFWANKAQYNDASRHAERVITNALYEPALSAIDLAMHALMNNEPERAYAALSELRTELVK